MRHIILIAVMTVAGLGCRAESGKAPEGGGATPPPAVAGAPPGSVAAAPARVLPDPRCGREPKDWCAAPEGDPCGAHKTVESCRADARCTGMKYRGEGPECTFDGAGFSTNCPTVGCISR